MRKKINEQKKKSNNENNMVYTIPDSKKLLKYIEKKFTGGVKAYKDEIKESLLKIIKK